MVQESPTRPAASSGRLILIALLALGLVARLALALLTTELRAVGLPDSLEFLATGQAVFDGEGFLLRESVITGRTEDATHVTLARRMPGYPALVAAGDFLFGRSVRAVLVFQAVCGAAMLAVAFWMAWRLGGLWAGIITVALLAFDPYQVYFTALLLPTVLTGLALALAAGAGLAYLDALQAGGRAWLWAALAGLAVAAATYLEPAAAWLAIVAGLAAAVAKDRRRLLAGWAVGAAVLVVALAPWMARNASEIGVPVLTTDFGAALYEGTLPPVTDPAAEPPPDPRIPEAEVLGEAQRDLFYLGQAVRRVGQSPLNWLCRAIGRAGETWGPEAILPGFLPMSAVAGWTSLLPTAILALVGVWVMRDRRPAMVWLLVPVIWVTLAHAMPVAPAWERLAVMPVLAVLGGVGLAKVLARGTAGLSSRG